MPWEHVKIPLPTLENRCQWLIGGTNVAALRYANKEALTTEPRGQPCAGSPEYYPPFSAPGTERRKVLAAIMFPE